MDLPLAQVARESTQNGSTRANKKIQKTIDNWTTYCIYNRYMEKFKKGLLKILGKQIFVLRASNDSDNY